ncbi:MAG: hypothetical protein OXD47_07125 [Gammaproteobacteria bacterium]|nr:hypothetical protein [Gammaproteobacteria bacterium]MCY4211799.1 hypothetical protein [Gammaproteobacteria bacterium]MCY4282907.1 hypothetical protein [Gammaproteobacteria bacterium]MCY4338559.1 hypothetical protein [Gammaproteobacteria bacterium]
MQLSLTNLRSGTHELRQAIERGEVVELTFHGKVIGHVNPAGMKNDKLDQRVVNAYFNRRQGDDPYAAIEQLKQARKGRGVR